MIYNRTLLLREEIPSPPMLELLIRGVSPFKTPMLSMTKDTHISKVTIEPYYGI